MQRPSWHNSQFREQVGPLQAAGVATVAYDFLGCGSSAKPRDATAYAPGELFADLEAVHDQYCKEHQAVFLVAHSFGTCLAVRLAVQLGSALTGLVLIGAFHPALGGGAMRGLFLLPETVLGWLQPLLTRQFMGLAFHANSHRRRPELLAQEARYSNANLPHMFRAFYRQVGEFFEPPESYDELLRAVAAPALVISGNTDRLTPLDSMGARVTGLLPRARLISLAHAGHQVFQEEPEAFNAALLNFMTSCLAPCLDAREAA
ncbi:hypothetical protein WJX81_001377 [Elliptochloris bilobata]|uniref:AB hydrolase-1 domain-containing protein n=1 Tax=Elliptochloris bilobata TaxID=381761 RepID=A0AAW1QHJ5_9CHLO